MPSNLKVMKRMIFSPAAVISLLVPVDFFAEEQAAGGGFSGGDFWPLNF
jgi:hypothetical protein